MKYIYTLFFTLTSSFLIAQTEYLHQATKTSHHHHGTVCGIGESTPGFFIPAPSKSRSNPENAAVFEVTYDDNVPPIARTSFERATAILADLFISPMPISVRVSSSSEQEANTLAGAFPGTYLRNFRNAPKRNLWYPISLAEKIARQEFNSTQIPFDIEVIYNRTQNWNYTSVGVSGNEFDFVTVMLHELLHGLGFSSLGDVSANQGTLKLSGWPAAYSSFLENNVGQNVVSEIEDPSIALGTEMRSNSLFINTPSLDLQNQRVKVYAPSIFTAGSSISHLDRNTFLGTPNALMSPSINFGSVIHNPGEIALNILYDLGWSYTSIIHEPGIGTEDVTQPYTVTATIFSDNGYDQSSVKMYYSRDTFLTANVLAMTPTGNADEYTATLPAPGELTKYQYYFTVEDNRQLTFSSPTEAPNPLFYEFFYDVDEIKPEIVHEAITSLDNKSTQLIIEASVTDFFAGIDEVLIDYQINGVAQEMVPMQRDLSDGFRPDLYVGTILIPENTLDKGDIFEYRIIANDKSPARNTINSPGSGFYQVEITKILEALNLYVNDFEVDEQDFNGLGFRIERPRGFQDPAIHSIHPYTNAGAENTRNFNYNLSIPIILRKTDALIEFDEIVLVEPGEPNTKFGDNEFWDYVIVEGRRTNSATWRPFLDGYDSQEDPLWESTYRNNIVNQNSTAVGESSLFRDRTIDMQANGNFSEGDTVLIRFRLFSDPFAVGWGWAIDNLRIQDTPVAVEDFVEEQDFTVYPNPVGGQALNIEATFKQQVNEVELQLSSIHGQLLHKVSYQPRSQFFATSLAIQDFPKGVYLLTLKMDQQEQISRRIIRQ